MTTTATSCGFCCISTDADYGHCGHDCHTQETTTMTTTKTLDTLTLARAVVSTRFRANAIPTTTSGKPSLGYKQTVAELRGLFVAVHALGLANSPFHAELMLGDVIRTTAEDHGSRPKYAAASWDDAAANLLNTLWMS